MLYSWLSAWVNECGKRESVLRDHIAEQWSCSRNLQRDRGTRSCWCFWPQQESCMLGLLWAQCNLEVLCLSFSVCNPHPCVWGGQSAPHLLGGSAVCGHVMASGALTRWECKGDVFCSVAFSKLTHSVSECPNSQAQYLLYPVAFLLGFSSFTWWVPSSQLTRVTWMVTNTVNIPLSARWNTVGGKKIFKQAL